MTSHWNLPPTPMSHSYHAHPHHTNANAGGGANSKSKYAHLGQYGVRKVFKKEGILILGSSL